MAVWRYALACVALAGGLGLVFAILSRWAPINGGKPWWQKHGLVTDLGYWIFVPIFMRYLRIWVTVCLTIVIFHIADGQKIADFYEHGHGPVSHLPLWVQDYRLSGDHRFRCCTGSIAPFTAGYYGNITPSIMLRKIWNGPVRRAFTP